MRRVIVAIATRSIQRGPVWGRHLSANTTGRPVTIGETMSDNYPRYTVRRFLQYLHDRERCAGTSRIAQIFCPEVDRKAGLELEAIIDLRFNGGGVTPQSFRVLRAEVIASGLDMDTVDGMTLAEFVERVRSSVSSQSDGKTQTPKEEPSKVKPSKLKPCHQLAYSQYVQVIKDRPELATATEQQVYNYYKEYLYDRQEDGELPIFSSWSKYVRTARNAMGESKNTPRSGREGRSIIRQRDM